MSFSNHSTLRLESGTTHTGNHNQITGDNLCIKGKHNVITGTGITVHGDHRDGHHSPCDHNTVQGDHLSVNGNYNTLWGDEKTMTVSGRHNQVNNAQLLENITKRIVQGPILPQPGVLEPQHHNARAQSGLVLMNGTIYREYNSMGPWTLDTLGPLYPLPKGQCVDRISPMWSSESRVNNNRSPNEKINNSAPVSMPNFPGKEECQYDELAAEGDDGNTCVICMERKRKCVARPCKHFSFCITCVTKELKTCPVCREPITGMERLYL